MKIIYGVEKLNEGNRTVSYIFFILYLLELKCVRILHAITILNINRIFTCYIEFLF